MAHFVEANALTEPGFGLWFYHWRGNWCLMQYRNSDQHALIIAMPKTWMLA